MIDRDTLPYRPCVGITLFNRDGLVFVGRRLDTPDAWQMPQGGIDPGEDVHTAGLRELKEEVGTDRGEIVAESSHWYDYDLPDHLIAKVWHGRFRGQRQKWLAVRFTGDDHEINLATEHPEFEAWRWVDPAHLPELAIWFKRPIYQAVLTEFAPHFK